MQEFWDQATELLPEDATDEEIEKKATELMNAEIAKSEREQELNLD